MTVVVTHTTPADSSFSTEGAAAWNANHALSGVGTMAEQNANSVAITGGTIDGTTLGATTPAAATFTTLTANTGVYGGGVGANADLNLYGKGTGSVVMSTGSNVQVKVTEAGVTNTSWMELQGGISATKVYANGSGSNIDFRASSKGTGVLSFYTNAQSQEQLRVTHTASAVNYVQVTGAATGSSPQISSQGSDANIGLQLRSKGTGAINLMTQGGLNQAVVFNSGDGTNFLGLRGGNTGIFPRISAEGSDTNISMALQSKGTGAIDLAAGSSGVNISNGTTVTALTVTANGSAYTSVPTATVSVPTTAGGVQATASVTMRQIGTPILVSGGTGYTVGDVLTMSGGTSTSAITVTVSTVSAGVITAVSATNQGSYTALPTNPVSVTGGTGSGATFNLNFGVSALAITNAGSGYVEQPTVTFSGGGGSGAAAYATVGSGTTVRSLGSTLDLSTPNGVGLRVGNSGATNSNFILARGASSNPDLGASAGALILYGGAGQGIAFYSNGYTNAQFNVSHTASAVNYVQVTGAATGSSPSILATGSDASVPLILAGKGGSSISFQTNGVGSSIQFLVTHTSAVANYIQTTGSTAGNAAKLLSAGTDTNIDLALTPKGTGRVQFGTYTANMALTVQGYIEIKDAGGTIRKLAVIG